MVTKKQGTVVEVESRIALWLRRVGDRLKAEETCRANAARKRQRENEIMDN